MGAIINDIVINKYNKNIAIHQIDFVNIKVKINKTNNSINKIFLIFRLYLIFSIKKGINIKIYNDK
jgi:hypothetical protein